MPTIIDSQMMSEAMRRYWFKRATMLIGRVDIIDPWHHTLYELRQRFGTGLRVYRCSTKGRWGKASQIVTL